MVTCATGSRGRLLFGSLLCAVHLWAADPATGSRVLLVVNDKSPVSRSIAEYYARERGVPAFNICHVRASLAEEIDRPEYNRLAGAIGVCLQSRNLVESVYYIVTTLGDPLKVNGATGLNGDAASVDSELTLLYPELHGGPAHRTGGLIANPYFGKAASEFSHPEFPMYLVTRLAAYDFLSVKAMIDRAMDASNRGKFVIDMAGDGAQRREMAETRRRVAPWAIASFWTKARAPSMNRTT